MPWTVDNPPPCAENWTADERERCVAAANAALEDGESEQDAIFACIGAAGKGDDGGKTMGREMEHKTLPFDVTGLDIEGRTLEGYAAAFGNTDSVGDIIHPGAFSKTLSERGGKVKFLWQHDGKEPIGPIMEMREDPQGLFIRALLSDTSRGRDALALLADKAIDGLSIGYDAIKGGTDYTTLDDGKKVRNLREIKLWEVSLVTFPANEQAQVVALKEDDKATMRSESDGKHPSSHYLVVEDAEKSTTWHLRVRNVEGDLDHRLMGAAWAALHGGYRGNRYEGPNAAVALAKLKKLYAQEGMDVPGKEQVFVDVEHDGTSTAFLIEKTKTVELLDMLKELEQNAPASEPAADDTVEATKAGPQDTAPTSEQLLGDIERALFDIEFLEV